jgi:exonuclease VII large subunit
VNEVRSKLSSGKLEEASKAYNRMAMRYGLLAERKEVKELEKDLRKAQSGNLLNAQQEVMANNAYFLQQSTDQQAKQIGAKFDDKTAGEQWVRLQRAQEVSTTTVRPLRVNLPVRGLRHSFSQVLQTEVGKPMRVSFVASNTRTPHWPLRIGLGFLCFGFLWSAVVLVQSQRKASAISAAGVA